MSYLVRTATTSRYPKYSIGAQFYAVDSDILHLDTDRKTFLAQSTTPRQLRYCVDYDLNYASPTWVELPNTQLPSGEAILKVMNTYDGEILILASVTYTEPITTANLIVTKVYKSSGWSVNRATATIASVYQFTVGLDQTGINIGPELMGRNGVIVLAGYEAQTVGGAGADTNDRLTKCGYTAVSEDFGNTWRKLFDPRLQVQSMGIPYPVNLHQHGACYDEDDDRVYCVVGDSSTGTAVGRTLGQGGKYSLIFYSDNWRDAAPTWNLVTQSSLYNVTQYTADTGLPESAVVTTIFPFGIFTTPDALVGLLDLNAPGAVMIWPKIGYRRLGEMLPGPSLGSGVGCDHAINRDLGIAGTDLTLPQTARRVGPLLASEYITGSSVTGTQDMNLAIGHDALNWTRIPVSLPVTAQTGRGFSKLLGPTVNGRIVLTARATINGGFKQVIADLIYD